jgi:hypothetical protein
MRLGRRLASIRWAASNTFGLCAFVASRLGVEIHGIIQLGAVKVVKVAAVKNHSCNLLMVNGVKPGQGESNQLAWGVKAAGRAAKSAGLGNEKCRKWVNSIASQAAKLNRKTRVNTLKDGYARVKTGSREKVNSGAADSLGGMIPARLSPFVGICRHLSAVQKEGLPGIRPFPPAETHFAGWRPIGKPWVTGLTAGARFPSLRLILNTHSIHVIP